MGRPKRVLKSGKLKSMMVRMRELREKRSLLRARRHEEAIAGISGVIDTDHTYSKVIDRTPAVDPLQDPLLLDRTSEQPVLISAAEDAIKYEVGGLQIQNNTETTNEESYTSVNSSDSAATNPLEQTDTEIKDEIEIEEFCVQEMHVVEPPPRLIPKPLSTLISPQIQASIPDLVFTFKSRYHQPTRNELMYWINNEMLGNRPDLTGNIEMIKSMNGCFMLRLKSRKGVQYRQGMFIQLGRSFRNAEHVQKRWMIERFDIIPGPAWIRVVNLPLWITGEEITKELSRFGRVIQIVSRPLGGTRHRILDGDTYAQMQVSRHIPTDLSISGCIASLNYCESPLISSPHLNY